VKARINNGGDMWWDLMNEAKYVVPKTGNVSSLFAGALWIGGLDVQGNLHVAAQTYRQNGNDFFPGPLDTSGNVTSQTCSDFDRIWKVNKTTIDSFIAGFFSIPPSSILYWPGHGNPYLSFAQQELAPYVDVDSNGYYDAAQGDYPNIPGDQALWFVFNDKGNTHGETGGLPLGIEVQCLAYAVKDASACTFSTTFYHYLITNKSSNDYNHVYIGMWDDPDLGCYVDDYIGSDSTSNSAVVYNGETPDSYLCAYNYGNQPPVLALKIFKGPTDDNGTTHYLDHTMYYVNDFSVIGNPETPAHYYQYLQSIWKDNTHLTFGGNGYGGAQSANYFYSDDPSIATGWSMCGLNATFTDMRFIVSSGPVSINAHESKTFDVAAVWDNTSVYPCPSFATIDSVAACAKDYFNGISLPSGIKNISSAHKPFSVFPNPVGTSSVISFSGKNFSQIEIFDLAGKKLFDSEVKKIDVLKLNSDQLGKGLFIYRITFNDHSSQSGKLVVQ
jgi:hypothetical protein